MGSGGWRVGPSVVQESERHITPPLAPWFTCRFQLESRREGIQGSTSAHPRLLPPAVLVQSFTLHSSNFWSTLVVNWLLLAPLLVISVRGCPGGQWRCGSGECVVLEAQCDGKQQCADGSDEAADQCEQSTCGPHLFQCQSGSQCVSNTQVCNGASNCKDSSDERPPSCISPAAPASPQPVAAAVGANNPPPPPHHLHHSHQGSGAPTVTASLVLLLSVGTLYWLVK